MIESWNPVPKGSTSSTTKRSFRDQQISEPGQKRFWVSGKAKKLCSTEFEKAIQRRRQAVYGSRFRERGLRQKRRDFVGSDNSSWRSPVPEGKSQIRRKYGFHGQSVSQPKSSANTGIVNSWAGRRTNKRRSGQAKGHSPKRSASGLTQSSVNWGSAYSETRLFLSNTFFSFLTVSYRSDYQTLFAQWKVKVVYPHRQRRYHDATFCEWRQYGDFGFSKGWHCRLDSYLLKIYSDVIMTIK